MKCYALRYESYNPKLGHHVTHLLDGKTYINPEKFLELMYEHLNNDVKYMFMFYNKISMEELKNMEPNSTFYVGRGGERYMWSIDIICNEIVFE